MVRAQDLGYQSKNLQDIPSKEERKRQQYLEALSNLTKQEPPERLSLVQLPDSLQSLTGE